MSPSPSDLDRMSAFLAEELARMSDRGLGDLQVRSNLAWSERSHVISRGAENLLAKARRDLAADHDYGLTPAERRRVRSLGAGERHDAAVDDVLHARAGDDEAAQRVVVTELLLALNLFEDELARRCEIG